MADSPNPAGRIAGAWSEDMRRALRDALLLVEYLGQSADGRLQAQFEDTRNRIADPGVKRTVPPCRTYNYFLQRLSRIELAMGNGNADPAIEEAAMGKEGEGDENLCALAFVRSSRDFLAGVAAPATVGSIRLTRAYVRHRGGPRRQWGRLLGWTGLFGTETDTHDEWADLEDRTSMESRAAKLAKAVRRLERLALPMVVLTLAVSTYALAGHLILDRHRMVVDRWLALDAQIQSAETEFSGQLVPVAAASPSLPSWNRQVSAGPDVLVPPNGSQPGTNRFCDRIVKAGETGGISSHKEADRFLNAKQIHLCGEADRAGVDRFIADLYLRSWTSVITGGVDWKIAPFGYHVIRIRGSLAPLFGIVHSAVRDYAGPDSKTSCPKASLDLADVNTARACASALMSLLGSSQAVAESILGALTLYVLPVCYGFLGAVAAIMRMLRTKIEMSTLNFTDRNRVRQDAILGILAGAVIGLFVGSIGKADPSSGAGLPALALLAGYNVSGVFRFLDEFSDRIFKPGKAGGSHG